MIGETKNKRELKIYVLQHTENLFLEILIEEIERHRENVAILLEDVLEIVDVANKIANCLSLAFNDFLLQIVCNTCIVILILSVSQSGVRVMTMNVIGTLQKLLLNLDSLSKSLDLVDIAMSFDVFLVGKSKVMADAALRHLLDHLESLAPGAVRQSMQNLLESGTVLQVCAKLSRHKKILKRSNKVIVGQLNEVSVRFFLQNQ